MANKIGVLTPASSDEYKRNQIHIKALTEIENLLKKMKEDNNNKAALEEEFDRLATARLIYLHLCKSPGYMTWDKIRETMKSYKNVDSALSEMIKNGLIKEAWIDTKD